LRVYFARFTWFSRFIVFCEQIFLFSDSVRFTPVVVVVVVVVGGGGGEGKTIRPHRMTSQDPAREKISQLRKEHKFKLYTNENMAK